MSSNYGGLFPQYNRHFFGLSYQQARFAHPLQYNPLGQTDQMSSLQLTGRFYLSPRWQLWAQVPYTLNSLRQGSKQFAWQGLGDMSLQLHFAAVETADSSFAAFRHRLLLGGSLSLPTGKYQQRLSNGNEIEAPMQLGTGAFGLGLQVQYLLRWERWGSNLSWQHRQFSRNELGYRFGYQQQSSMLFFYDWQTHPLGPNLLPQGGLVYERIGTDVQWEMLQARTGGQQLLLHLGLDFYWKDWQWGLYGQYNLWRLQAPQVPVGDLRWQVQVRKAI